jgi:hypothetical protein
MPDNRPNGANERITANGVRAFLALVPLPLRRIAPLE